MSDDQITFGVFGPPDLPPVFPSKIFVAQVVKIQEKNIGTQNRVTLSLWDGGRITGTFCKTKPDSLAEFSYQITTNIFLLQMPHMIQRSRTAQPFKLKT